MKTLPLRWLAAAALSWMGVCFPVVGAETEATTSRDSEEEPQELETVVVTGSHLPSAGELPANPVTVLGPVEIARSGVNNDLLQVLRKTAPQFSGRRNVGQSNANVSAGFTQGASSLAFRNAPTLVLVNGRRLANAPTAASGGWTFVDVNAIPIAAIERVEILADGGSAIYGADAVSGVVNILLKTDYQGAEIGGRFGITDNEGHYQERAAWAVAGGVLPRWGTRITASFEWQKTDSLFGDQRAFSRPSYGTTSFAGVVQEGSYDSGYFIGGAFYYLDPNLNSPRPGASWAERGYLGPLTAGQVAMLFDLSHGETLLLGDEKKLATLAFDQKLGPHLTLFGDAMYTRTQTVSQMNGLPLMFRMRASGANNPFGEALSVRNRFVDHPRTYSANTDSYRAVVGLRGAFNGRWFFETALDYNRIQQDYIIANLIRTRPREEAMAAGTLNLFAREQTSGVVDSVVGAVCFDALSTLFLWDAKVVGTDLFSLPGGGLSFAAGVEYRKEALKAAPGSEISGDPSAFDDGTTVDVFNESFEVYSGFAEVQVPLVGAANRRAGIHDLRLISAVRYEQFSNADDPVVPKVTLNYQPTEDLKLRAALSRSFIAPTLGQLHAPGATTIAGPVPQFGGGFVSVLLTPTEKVVASRSHNTSFGFVWTPRRVKGFSAELNVFRIRQDDIIRSLAGKGPLQAILDDVDARGPASPYVEHVHVGDFAGPIVSRPGQISELGLDNIYFVAPASGNIGTVKISGFDLRLSYDLRLGDAGTLRLESSSTYYARYDSQPIAGAAYIPSAGLATTFNGTIPRWRTYGTLTYRASRWESTVGFSYCPPTRDAEWSEAWASEGYRQTQPACVTWDASVSGTLGSGSSWLKRLRFTLGVTNLTNNLPAKVVASEGADIAEFSPIGRFWYCTARYTF